MVNIVKFGQNYEIWGKRRLYSKGFSETKALLKQRLYSKKEIKEQYLVDILKFGQCPEIWS